MSTAPQHSTPLRSYYLLPPVAVTGHALFQFSKDLQQQLGDLEKRFATQKKPTSSYIRSLWQLPPQKPR